MSKRTVENIVLLVAELGGIALIIYGIYLIWKPLAVIASGVVFVLLAGAIYNDNQRHETEGR